MPGAAAPATPPARRWPGTGETGCYTDSETGLVLLGARYYCPAIGRFISRDPAGFVNGPNVYAYCGDDPVNFSDPSGLASGLSGAAETVARVFVPGADAAFGRTYDKGAQREQTTGCGAVRSNVGKWGSAKGVERASHSAALVPSVL